MPMKEHKDTMEGETQIPPCWDAPSPSYECHQPTKGPSLQVKEQSRKAGRQIRTPGKGYPAWLPPRTALAALSRQKTHQGESLGATMWITFQTQGKPLLLRGVGHLIGCWQ